jgi:hypothetical protein
MAGQGTKKSWIKPKLVVLVRDSEVGISVLRACKEGNLYHEVHYDDWTCYSAWMSVGSDGDTCWSPYPLGRKCLIMDCSGRKVEGPCDPPANGVYYPCPTKAIWQTCPSSTLGSS